MGRVLDRLPPTPWFERLINCAPRTLQWLWAIVWGGLTAGLRVASPKPIAGLLLWGLLSMPALVFFSEVGFRWITAMTRPPVDDADR